jgi:hypothetical protein
MRRLVHLVFVASVVLLTLVNIAFGSNKTQTHSPQPNRSPGAFGYWMAPASNFHASFDPSSPDNWLGGTGNWSNGADWSAGEPGSSSDVFINTGNDNVTLDTNASINSLTLGGSTGSSMLAGNYLITIAGSLTVNQTGTLAASVTANQPLPRRRAPGKRDLHKFRHNQRNGRPG